MNGLRQVWRDINRQPFFMVEKEGAHRDQPLAKAIFQNLADAAKPAVPSSKPRILIARPKTKPLNRNDKIRLSLERAYPSQASQILDQAYAAYYYTRPASANLPELYELLESGFLDQGIEACGLHSWVIGRSK